METLHGKPVVLVTKEGEAVSVGRFHIEGAPVLEAGRHVEVVFETEALSCRLRVPLSKIEEIKTTWNGEWFRYVLQTGEAVWRGTEAGPEISVPRAGAE